MDFELKQIQTSKPFLGFIESRQGGRPDNQDSCGFADTLLGLLVVVCDGMGGGPGGKTASSVAVETIIQTVRSATADSNRIKTIEAAIQNSNYKLQTLQKEKVSLDGMGTTVTILLINEFSALIAHVGDSRIYHLRRGNKIFRTEDHSLVGEMVRKKAMTEEEARISPHSNILQRALGISETVKVDISERAYEKGDRFVLCTDGIWASMNEKELIKIIACTKSLSGTIEKTMVKVDEIGGSNGGQHDNFTMALLTTTHNSILKETMTTKVRNIIFGLIIICGFSLIGNVIQFMMRPNNPNFPSVQERTNDSIIKEQERRIQEMREQIVAMKQKNDDIFNKLEDISNSSKEVAQIVKKNNEEKLKEKNLLIAKIDELINRLEILRDMEQGNDKDQQISETLDMVKTLSKDLTPFGVNKQLDRIIELLNTRLARSDSNDEEFKEHDKYKGHWDGVKANNKGIITIAKEIKTEISKK